MINIKKHPKCIHFDKHTIEKCEKYGGEHGLSFSSVIRLIVNDFFLKQEGS